MIRGAAIAGIVVLMAMGAMAPSAATDVHGDDGADRYVGSGGVLLPRSVSTPVRSRVAGCDDCHWRMASPCVTVVGPGTPFPGQATCQSVVRGCPALAQLLRVWFQPSGGSWVEVGLVCVARSGPVTMANLRREAVASFAADLPVVAIVAAPPQGALVQLPVVFDSGQPGGVWTGRYNLLGAEVDLRATPTWEWRFGDGATIQTDLPGGRYPDLSVAHAYRRAGRYLVRVQTRWTAQFDVDGLGPFAIAEPVTQEASRAVDVGEGRAVLSVR